MKQKLIWIDVEDERASETICARYGLEPQSAAVRFAVWVLARSDLRLEPQQLLERPPTPKHARRSPKLNAPLNSA